MNATMITCPGCGAEIPLKRSARGAISARERGTPESSRRQVEQKVRADFAVEKQFLEGQLAEERRRCREAQQAELELRKERGALEARAQQFEVPKERVFEDCLLYTSPSPRD